MRGQGPTTDVRRATNDSCHATNYARRATTDGSRTTYDTRRLRKYRRNEVSAKREKPVCTNAMKADSSYPTWTVSWGYDRCSSCRWPIPPSGSSVVVYAGSADVVKMHLIPCVQMICTLMLSAGRFYHGADVLGADYETPRFVCAAPIHLSCCERPPSGTPDHLRCHAGAGRHRNAPRPVPRQRVDLGIPWGETACRPRGHLGKTARTACPHHAWRNAAARAGYGGAGAAASAARTR